MEDKLWALEELVQKQLDAHHIEESTSPWNSVFVVKEIWKMENGDRSKSCQQGYPTYGPFMIWNSSAFPITKRMASYSY